MKPRLALLLVGSFVAACGGHDGSQDAGIADAGEVDLSVDLDDAGVDVDGAMPVDLAQPGLRYAYMVGAGVRLITARVDPQNGALYVLDAAPAGTAGLTMTPALSPDGTVLVEPTGPDQKLASFKVDPSSGWLTPAPGSPLALGFQLYAPTFSPSGKFVYAYDGANNKVQTFSVAATGALSQVGTGVLGAGSLVGLAVTPSGKYLYMGTSHAIAGYALQADGTPAMLAGFPFDVGVSNSPNGLVMSPSGKYLAVAMAGTDTLAMYTVDDTSGALAAVAGSPYALGTTPQPPAFTPDEKYLYAPYESALRAFSIGSGGALTPLATQPIGAALSVSIDRWTGRFLYVQRSYYEMEVKTIAADGTLTAGPRWASYAYGVTLSAIGAAVQPAPKFAYVADSEAAPTGAIRAYSLDGAGAMSPIAGSNTLAVAADTVADPRGRWLYAVSAIDGVHAYAIAAGGALQELVGSPYALSGASHVAIDPSARTLFVTRSSNNSVDTYSIDQSTGALTYGSAHPTGGTGPSGIAVSPLGGFVWVADQTSNDLVIFYSPGPDILLAPTNIPTGPTTAPLGLAFSPDGEHVFATLTGTGELVSYGALDPSGKPTLSTKYPVGSKPESVAVDPRGRFVYVTDSGIAGTASYGTHLYQFSIDPSSTILTALAPPTVTSLAVPYALAIDPSGAVLLAACQGSGPPAGGLSRYSLGGDGVLASLSGALDVGPVPRTVTIVGTH